MVWRPAGAPPSAASAVVCGLLVMLGLAQKYWAIRVALDAELFARLAGDTARLAMHTTDLDQALHSLVCVNPPTLRLATGCNVATPRFRLLRLQAAWLVAQLLLALVVILRHPWLSWLDKESYPCSLCSLLAITSAARLLTGARAPLAGLHGPAGQRLYFANHSSHGDFCAAVGLLPPELRDAELARWPAPTTG